MNARRSRSPGRAVSARRSRSPGRAMSARRSRSPGRAMSARRSRSPGPAVSTRRSRSPRPAMSTRKSRSPGPARRKRRSRSPGPAMSTRRSRSPGPALKMHRSRSPGPALKMYRSRSPRPKTCMQRSRSPRPSTSNRRSCSPRSSSSMQRSRSPRPTVRTRSSRSPRQSVPARRSWSPRSASNVRRSRSPRPGTNMRKSRSPRCTVSTQRSRSPKPAAKMRRSVSPRGTTTIRRSTSPRPADTMRRSISPRPASNVRRSISPRPVVNIRRSVSPRPGTNIRKRSVSPRPSAKIRRSISPQPAAKIKRSRSPRPTANMQRSGSPRPLVKRLRSNSPRPVAQMRSPRRVSPLQSSGSPRRAAQMCISPSPRSTECRRKSSSPRPCAYVRASHSPRPATCVRRSCSPRQVSHMKQSRSPAWSPARKSVSQLGKFSRSPSMRYSDSHYSPSHSSCSRKQSLSPRSRNYISPVRSGSPRERQESPQSKRSPTVMPVHDKRSITSQKKSVSPRCRKRSVSPEKRCVKSPFKQKKSISPKRHSPEVQQKRSPINFPSKIGSNVSKHVVQKSISPVSRITYSPPISPDRPHSSRKLSKGGSPSSCTIKAYGVSGTRKKSPEILPKKSFRLSKDRENVHYPASQYDQGLSASPEIKASHAGKSYRSPRGKASPHSKASLSPVSPQSSFSCSRTREDDHSLRRKDRALIREKPMPNSQKNNTSIEELCNISDNPSFQKSLSQTPSLSPSPEKHSESENKYYTVPLRVQTPSVDYNNPPVSTSLKNEISGWQKGLVCSVISDSGSNAKSSRKNIDECVTRTRSELKSTNCTKQAERKASRKHRMKDCDKKERAVLMCQEESKSSTLNSTVIDTGSSTVNDSGPIQETTQSKFDSSACLEHSHKTNRLDPSSEIEVEKETENVSKVPNSPGDRTLDELEDLLELELDKSVDLWESDESEVEHFHQESKNVEKPSNLAEDPHSKTTATEKDNAAAKGRLKDTTGKKLNYSTREDSLGEENKMIKSASAESGQRKKRSDTRKKSSRKSIRKENKRKVEQLGEQCSISKTESADESMDLTDGKDCDLRTELSRRRAERLLKAGSLHNALPARLLQSAFRGLVGRKTAKKDASDRKSCDREKQKRDKKEKNSPSKVPVHLRLGLPGSSWDTESSHSRRRGYRKVKLKRSVIVSSERGHKV